MINTHNKKLPCASKTMARYAMTMALAITLIACSEKKTLGFLDSAQGVWRTECQNLGVDSDYRRISLNVNKTLFEFSNESFEDPSCDRQILSYLSSGTLLKHDRRLLKDELHVASIDYEIDQVTVVINNQNKADEYNSNAVCARTDWQVDIMFDVSNCSDIAGTTVPRIDYDLYTTNRLINALGQTIDVLYSGNPRGSTEETRPQTPDTRTPYWLIARNDGA